MRSTIPIFFVGAENYSEAFSGLGLSLSRGSSERAEGSEPSGLRELGRGWCVCLPTSNVLESIDYLKNKNMNSSHLSSGRFLLWLISLCHGHPPHLPALLARRPELPSPSR